MQAELRHLPSRLHSLAAMSELLQRLELQPGSASPEQYRGVARQVSALLAQAEPDAHLQALLAAAPATSELYENMRYELAGLCRSPLERALRAEQAAVTAINRARRTAAA